LNIENTTAGIKKTRRGPLEDKDGNAGQTVPQAVAELKRLQTHRADNVLPELRRTPGFGDYADKYLAFIKSGVGPKKPGTIQKEESHLNLWRKHIEGIRLDRIKRVHVNAFIEARLKTGVSGRTVNPQVHPSTTGPKSSENTHSKSVPF
jgi:hypothetical protein